MLLLGIMFVRVLYTDVLKIARKIVLRIAESIGFEVADVGPISLEMIKRIDIIRALRRKHLGMKSLRRQVQAN